MGAGLTEFSKYQSEAQEKMMLIYLVKFSFFKPTTSRHIHTSLERQDVLVASVLGSGVDLWFKY